MCLPMDEGNWFFYLWRVIRERLSMNWSSSFGLR